MITAIKINIFYHGCFKRYVAPKNVIDGISKELSVSSQRCLLEIYDLTTYIATRCYKIYCRI